MRGIPKGRVPSPGVVEARDVLELGESGVGPGSKALAMEQFAFQAGEEALAQGIVVAVTYRTHRGSDRGLPALIADGHLGVLQSLAAVVDHRVGSVHSKGHAEGVCDQFASQVVGYGPADDAYARRVQFGMDAPCNVGL